MEIVKSLFLYKPPRNSHYYILHYRFLVSLSILAVVILVSQVQAMTKLLSLKDFEGREINEEWSVFETFLEVAAVASDKFQREKQERLRKSVDLNKAPILISENSPNKTVTFSSEVAVTNDGSIGENPPDDSPKKAAAFSSEVPEVSDRFLGEYPLDLCKKDTERFDKFMKNPLALSKNEEFISEKLVKKPVTFRFNLPEIDIRVVRENLHSDLTKKATSTGETSLRSPVPICSDMSRIDDRIVKEKPFDLSMEGCYNGQEYCKKRYRFVLGNTLDLCNDEKTSLIIENSFKGSVIENPLIMPMNEWLSGEQALKRSLASPVAKKSKTEMAWKKPAYTDPLKKFEKNGQKRSLEGQERNSQKLKKQKKNLDFGPDPPPPLPEPFMDRIRDMEGTEVMLVIQKPLYRTDVCRLQGRLSIPVSQAKIEFLTKYEKQVLDMHDGKNWMGINVKLIEPVLLNVSSISLKRWNMSKESGNVSSSYVLTKSWNSVVEKNDLKADDIIQLWSFRQGQNLCLALVILSRARVGVSSQHIQI